MTIFIVTSAAIAIVALILGVLVLLAIHETRPTNHFFFLPSALPSRPPRNRFFGKVMIFWRFSSCGGGLKRRSWGIFSGARPPGRTDEPKIHLVSCAMVPPLRVDTCASDHGGIPSRSGCIFLACLSCNAPFFCDGHGWLSGSEFIFLSASVCRQVGFATSACARLDVRGDRERFYDMRRRPHFACLRYLLLFVSK